MEHKHEGTSICRKGEGVNWIGQSGLHKGILRVLLPPGQVDWMGESYRGRAEWRWVGRNHLDMGPAMAEELCSSSCLSF